MSDDRHNDVIGTGAAGDTFAHRLARSGFFPSIGAVNPSLTAIANALRVWDHVLDRFG